MEWGGEFEDSSQAQAALAGALPAFLLVMVFIVIVLFNSLRIALRIWLVVPLALLGIVVGLAFATVLTLFVVPVLYAAFFLGCGKSTLHDAIPFPHPSRVGPAVSLRPRTMRRMRG
jgi:multidrug efflux pump subunit AcrB